MNKTEINLKIQDNNILISTLLNTPIERVIDKRCFEIFSPGGVEIIIYCTSRPSIGDCHSLDAGSNENRKISEVPARGVL
ncbi:MAG: hypothetical protein CMO13_01970 [Thaumarchaeota archaeon]|nr:hypothetical protein [Nitrososphaerota archaeon]